MGYREIAENNAACGHNCCQSVFAAFCEDLGLDKETGLKLSGGLGAGVCRKGDVCGAVSGGIMAMGLKFGFYDLNDPESKDSFVTKVQKFMAEFEQKHGAIDCRDLLGYNISTPDEYQKAVDNKAFELVCRGLIGDSAEMVERYLNE